MPLLQSTASFVLGLYRPRKSQQDDSIDEASEKIHFTTEADNLFFLLVLEVKVSLLVEVRDVIC